MTEPVYTEATASFDDDRIYRYNLLRRWMPGPTALFIMLNPSDGNEDDLDPTLHRCIFDFTMQWKIRPARLGYSADAIFPSAHMILDGSEAFGAMEVANLNAFVSSDPDIMRAAKDPIGPNNDAAISSAVKRASLTIAAWGDRADPARERAVAQMLSDMGVQPYALRLTKSGAPSHPLARGRSRIPSGTIPKPWHARGLR